MVVIECIQFLAEGGSGTSWTCGIGFPSILTLKYISRNRKLFK